MGIKQTVYVVDDDEGVGALDEGPVGPVPDGPGGVDPFGDNRTLVADDLQPGQYFPAGYPESAPGPGAARMKDSKASGRRTVQ